MGGNGGKGIGGCNIVLLNYSMGGRVQSGMGGKGGKGEESKEKERVRAPMRGC